MSSDSEWSAFFESSNDTRILMLCIANTRRNVLQSCSLVHDIRHQDILAARFEHHF